MNLVDRLLAEHHEELGLDRLGLRRGLRSALVTPGFTTSRHVVAMVFEPGGRTPRLVVKLPRRAGDNAGVETEARMLRRLTTGEGRPLAAVPKFIGLLSHDGHSMLVEEAVTGTQLSPAQVLRDPHRAVEAGARFTAALPGSGGSEPETGWYERSVRRPLDRLAALEPFGARTAEVVSRTHTLLEPLRHRGLPTVVEHGDLSHPNLFIGPDGGLRVIDWERSDVAGMPGQDLVYFLQYVNESVAGAYDPPAQLETFDRAFVGTDAPARRWLLTHLTARGVDEGLLPQVVVATWARAAATLPSRLLTDDGAADASGLHVPAEVRSAVRGDRDVLLWRHALERATDLR